MTKKTTAADTDPAFAAGRRRWLMGAGAGLAGALGAGTLGNLVLGTRMAHAADYKALVCIFLYGGNDGLNTIVPLDAARYNQYAAVRQGLALPRASLLGLPGIDHGLHPALSGLAPAWNAGHLAPVFNVGTLARPLTKAQYRAAAGDPNQVPDSLFSHSAQQTHWESGTANSFARTGWGGRASSALGTANPVISVGGATRFGQSDIQGPLVLPGLPGELFGAYRIQPEDLTWEVLVARKASLDLLFSQQQETAVGDAYAAVGRNAFVVSDRLKSLVRIKPRDANANAVIDAAFAPLIAGDRSITTGLGRQLYQIAKLILGNATVQGNRQIFYARMDSFDTHGNQSVPGNPTEGYHARLLKELGDAVGCFHAAMRNLGLGDAVTAFTQSDFGRTFAPNLTHGTDHGWGNHQLVIGGAVKGGRSYGSHPELALGGVNDVGVDPGELQGRWLPTTSVDQYGATLLNWFGASDAQQAQILPNLGNFATRRLGFV
jgi:uncharacterized protein (DUF1501 family)